MAIVASQLTAKVEITGVDQAKADLQNMGTSSQVAQEQLDQLAAASVNVGAALANRFTAEVANAKTGMQQLAVEAEAAGLDVTKFTTLQVKAAEVAARYGLAQAQAAAAQQRANEVAASGTASAEEIALAQEKAAVAATKVDVAENNAAIAIAKVEAEAASLTAAMDEQALASSTSATHTGFFSNAIQAASEKSGGFFSGIKNVAGGLLEFGSKVGMTIMGVKAMGSMFVGAATSSGQMIGDFQEQLTKLATTANESKDNISLVSKGILSMAGETATPVKDLGDAMYWVESAGFHGAAGLDVLKIAAQGAKAENANVTDVVRVVTAAMNTYRGSNLDAAEAMNTMIAAVSTGSMTLDGLSGAVSNVLPVSAKFGISLRDTVAGLATMTMQGDDAASAATHLRQVILALEAPASKGASSLKDIGLTTQQVSDSLRKSLPDTIQMITDALGKKFPEGSAAYNEAIKNISGGNKQMLALLETSGGQLQIFKDNVKTVAENVKSGGDAIAGWAEVQQNFNFRMDQAKAAVGAFGIQIGTALAPMATQLVGVFADKVMPAITILSNWFLQKGLPALQQFSAYIEANFLPSLQKIGGALGTINIFDWLSHQIQLAMPLLSQIGKGFSDLFANIAKYMSSDNFTNFVTDIYNLGNAIIRLDLTNLKLIGPIVKDALGILGSILTGVVIPAVDALVVELIRMEDFLNSTSVWATIAKGAILGFGSAIVGLKIAAIINSLPLIIMFWGSWAAGAGAAAVATIAATWPILAIGAVIGAVVAGIVVAVQHWGEIMDWISGKADQTRASVELSHEKMKLAQATKTADGAKAAVDNLEKERLGIIDKLKQTTDAVEKAHLERELKATTASENGAKSRLQIAEKNKKEQIQKQKELQDQMDEVSKPWYTRLWDDIVHGFQVAWNWIVNLFGGIGKWFGDRWHDVVNIFEGVGAWFGGIFSSAWNAVTRFFASIGKWFGDRWHDIQNAFSAVGAWFGGIFNDAWNAITKFFAPIGKWFNDRWNEIMNTTAPFRNYMGAVFETIWNIIVALFGIAGKWFGDRWNDIKNAFGAVGTWFGGVFSTAWDAITKAFGAIGKWFGDRWNDIKNIFGVVGKWFGDIFLIAIGAIYLAFMAIGKWFGDRWHDIQNVWNVVAKWFGDLFQSAWNGIVKIFTPIGKWFGDRWNDIVRIFTPIGKWFGDRFNEAWNSIVNVFTPIGKWFGDRWNDVINGVNSFIKSVGDSFNKLKDDAGKTFKSMMNGIIDALNGGIDALSNFVNFFGQGLDDIAKALGTKGTIPIVHFGHIAHLASGTESHEGGPAIVGEQGRELVWLPKGTKVTPNGPTEQILKSGVVPGYAGGAGNWVDNVLSWVGNGAKAIVDNMINALGIKAPQIMGIKEIAGKIFNQVKDWAVSWVSSLLPSVGSSGFAVNVPGNVTSWIATAMGLKHTPQSWAADLGVIAMKESGGNPNAINLTDSNAKAGHPSQGLFQTIPSTFNAYALPGHHNILNPVDNAAAAIGYIASRYGDVFHVPGIVSMSHGGPYQGYARGTDNAPGGMAIVGENGPEMVYLPKGSSVLPNSRLSNVGSPTIVVNPPAIYLDGRLLASGLMPYITNAIRYHTGVIQ